MELKKLQELIQSKPDLLRKRNADEIDSKKNEKSDSSDDESCSDEDEHFVSSTQIELEKTEERVRFLMLDLNNEQVKNQDLSTKITDLTNKLKTQDYTIQYTKDCIQFMNGDHEFLNTVSLKNITEYNRQIIENARKFFKIEREYKKIKEYTQIDPVIQASYDLLITRTFDQIKISYETVNGSLNMVDKTMKMIRTLMYILLFTNIVTVCYSFSK
jgi:hypothetical protein